MPDSEEGHSSVAHPRRYFHSEAHDSIPMLGASPILIRATVVRPGATQTPPLLVVVSSPSLRTSLKLLPLRLRARSACSYSRNVK